jgi:hypothetical protein
MKIGRMIFVRVAAAWLSPSAFLFVVLGALAWIYVPQVATRGLAALDGVNGVLDTLNRPETGLLARADATLANVDTASRAWSASSQQQAASVGAILRDTRATLWQVNHAVAGLGPLTGALTKTVQSANAALVSTDRAAVGLVPLEAQLGATAREYEQVGAAAVPVLDNTQLATREVVGMTVDGHRVADHLERVFDRPTRWWEKILPTAIVWCERGWRAVRRL